MKPQKFRPGTTNLIIVTSVREDSCVYITDTRESLYRFWGDVVAGSHNTTIRAGDPGPSHADEAITRRIKEAATLMQIRLVDHVIVGGPSRGLAPHYSFRERGLIA